MPAAKPIPPPRVPPQPGRKPAGGAAAVRLGRAALPDSVPEDLRATWALRARIGRAYWPEWVATAPAPVLVLGSTRDYLVNHPHAPGDVDPPAPIPGGGGKFQATLDRVPYPSGPWARLETVAGVTCVPYDVERGRPGTRAEIAVFLAHRDFLAFESRVGNPVWATPGDTGRVRALRLQTALLASLDREGLALRQAVAAPSDSERIAWAERALAAAREADRAASAKAGAAALLDWVRAARRFEGAAQYVRVLLNWQAGAVAAGDTAQTPVTAVAPHQEAQRLWRERAAATSERTVTGGHLGAISEVGALYCALLDAWTPNWREGIFGPDYSLTEALRRAVKNAGNHGATGG
jgi:hypothetical protein